MIPPDPKSLMKEGQENLPKVEQMGTMTLEELHEYHCNNPDRRMLCMFGTLKGGQHEEGDPPAAATFVRSLAGIVTRAHATQKFGITDRLFSPSIFPLSKIDARKHAGKVFDVTSGVKSYGPDGTCTRVEVISSKARESEG